MNVRKYASQYIKDVNSRILEFGPLTRCLLDRKKYNNYFFADIRSTEEVKKLYSGNEYLKRTGLHVDTSEVINIDYVVKGSYKETFKKVEKFDYVIVSHVLEHIPNLLDFFIDVQNILRKDGEIIIIYPDRRFCFDHFRSDSKFSDIFDVWENGENKSARQALDFFTNVIAENNPIKFWDVDVHIQMYEGKNTRHNLISYSESKKGKKEGDVHYWPFSDYAFLKFLRDCRLYNIFDFSIKKFIPTQKDTQEFLVIISFEKNNEFLDIDRGLILAKKYFVNTYFKISYYKNQISSLNQREQALLSEIKKKENDIKLISKELIEQTRVRNMVKVIIKKSLLLFKKIILFFPNKISRSIINDK